MEKSDFTPFEKEIIEWMLEGQDPVLQELRKQFSSATVKSRENTGVGMYLNFKIPKSIKRVNKLIGIKERFSFGDVGARIGTRQQEVGFLLWVLDGHLEFLEGYSYGDEKWPENINGYQLYYFGDKHDVDELRKAWSA